MKQTREKTTGQKRTAKKLNVSKETIRDLGTSRAKGVKGGRLLKSKEGYVTCICKLPPEA
jgi:hypothetical protein